MQIVNSTKYNSKLKIVFTLTIQLGRYTGVRITSHSILYLSVYVIIYTVKAYF